MQKKGANISLKGYDDIFSTDQSRAEAQQERVQEIPLSELHPFEGHPFRVVDDEEMMKTAESVRDFGVLTPAIVRPDPDGGYEIVSGHRRHRASELAGKETMPAIVRDLDDDAAIILMVDANLQRESILPSERAFAYKMKLDAIKHQGQRTDLTSSQVGMKLQAMDIVGQEAGESRNQVHRYIRLTELIPELLDMVDTGQIKFNPAVELSYLASEEQKDFLSAMDYGKDAKSLLKELQSQNERMFMVTFLVLNTGRTEQELENNVFQAQSIAQKHNCNLRRLDFQQESGLMSSLPLAQNLIEIRRGLTTSSTAIFVPFTTQELFQNGGETLYYGLNALSNNLIMVDRKKLKNPNGLILGTPGSGKSFSAKREITNAFLVTDDDIIICDPEAEVRHEVA